MLFFKSFFLASAERLCVPRTFSLKKKKKIEFALNQWKMPTILNFLQI